jgi:hypothetical protein
VHACCCLRPQYTQSTRGGLPPQVHRQPLAALVVEGDGFANLSHVPRRRWRAGRGSWLILNDPIRPFDVPSLHGGRNLGSPPGNPHALQHSKYSAAVIEKQRRAKSLKDAKERPRVRGTGEVAHERHSRQTHAHPSEKHGCNSPSGGLLRHRPPPYSSGTIETPPPHRSSPPNRRYHPGSTACALNAPATHGRHVPF